MAFSTFFTIAALIVLAESCSDSGSNCANWVKNGFCKSAYYTYAQKYSYCASSCGYCSSTTTSSSSSSCSNSASACSSWAANGFCTSTFYTTAQKAAYCASSCGLCSSTTTASSSTCSDSVTT
ncbi:unnamed protein product [Caenorhabditis angaria]|uniref:ShKT domain-containing protein n=1 Tax=Caenorhabditis angaria TaxID=860376 RepID=A0A9P1IAX0_9PELO|nr:unnamed protein product [Caenorhabditis angaria]